MVKAERLSKLRHFITCLKCEVSGKYCDDNCPTQYGAGNMGEIIENFESILKTLEQEPKTGRWIEDDEQIHVEKTYHCSECGYGIWGVDEKSNYCPNCGAKMKE